MARRCAAVVEPGNHPDPTHYASAMTPERGRALSVGVLLFTVGVVVVAALLSGLGLKPRVDVPGGTVLGAPTARPELPGAARVIAAGDMADCTVDWDEATARLVESYAGTVLALGDNAYENGSAADYRDCYAPSWGVFRDRTWPVPGNHDYQTPGAAGYLGYFGDAVAPDGHTWYAFDIGTWRIYALDANCAALHVCDATAQLAWLGADLAANPRTCVLAAWHQPRFSSGRHGDDPSQDPLWRLLTAAGADVVLNGHDHMYERFAPLDADGRPSATGMREFVVGTGGRGLYEIHDIQPGSQVRDATTHGVLVLDLRDGRYDWTLEPAEGSAGFTDSGADACH